jgi:hypothetical protein
MSAEALAAGSVDEAIASYRDKKLSRGQLIAALTLAGATAAGAATFVQAIDSSLSTPAASPPAIVKQGGHQQATGIAKTDQVALHARHIELQTGR